MKKWLVLVILLGVIRIGGVIYYDSKLLSEPIALASAIDRDFGVLHLSYITNRSEPRSVHWVDVGGRGLFPQNMYDDWSEFGELSTDDLFVETTYYSLYSTAIPLQPEEDFEGIEDFEDIGDLPFVIVHYDDGSSEKVDVELFELYDAPQLTSVSSGGDSEGSYEIFKVVEPFTVSEVKLSDERIDITSFRINQQEYTLPLSKPIEVNSGDSIYLKITGGTLRFVGDRGSINLVGTNKAGEPQSISLFARLNDAPSEEWINQKVREEKEK